MGYIGTKMSERAMEAHNNGEKPYSQWSKEDLLDCLPSALFEQAKKLTLNELKSELLYTSSWHHTGSYFNNTDFYSLDEDFIELSKNEIVEVLNNRMSESKKAKEAKKEEKLQKCFITYVEWEGTRKHPKAVDREAYGIIKGNWVHTEYGKKSLNGKYVHVVKEFDKAPRGTAQIFKNIENGLR